MKTVLKSFVIFLLFFALSLPVVAFANHIAAVVLQKQTTYQMIGRIVGSNNLTPMPTPSIKNGDADMNNIVNYEDIRYILNNWNHSASGSIDQYEDGKINSFDFAVTAKRLN